MLCKARMKKKLTGEHIFIFYVKHWKTNVYNIFFLILTKPSHRILWCCSFCRVLPGTKYLSLSCPGKVTFGSRSCFITTHVPHRALMTIISTPRMKSNKSNREVSGNIFGGHPNSAFPLTSCPNELASLVHQKDDTGF